MVFSCCCSKPATIAALMAVSERRSDRPAAPGSREECRRLAAGEEDRERAIAVKVGERGERIAACDPPIKGRYGRGQKQPDRRASAQRHPLPCDRQTTAVVGCAIELQRLAPPLHPTEKARLLVLTP